MHTPKNVLVTGGAGFIGSNFVRRLLAEDQTARIVNLDLLTYAGSKSNLRDLPNEARHTLVEGDICDAPLVGRLFREREIDTVVHFAAESHVDRSITGPAAFIQTNIVGTFTLLEAAREVWGGGLDNRRFVHVSTDEVYGSLDLDDPAFEETTPYAPNSPYSASKAASDHLVRAYRETYGMPCVTTNCSNNYGPYHFPEKLIPLVIINALTGKELPIYGDGAQVRDWLYVEDHCSAIDVVMRDGRLGETYNIGGEAEAKNIDTVRAICDLLDKIKPREDGASYREQIVHISDRPGHDRRYAMNIDKIRRELGWQPAESLKSGMAKTVEWYLSNQTWVNDVMSETYDEWIKINYTDRV